ncbi:MAG: polymer-forming cytoskeletal protein [Pseudomonadota bacterium]
MPSSIIEEDLIVEGNVSSSEGSVDVKGRVVGDVSAETITIRVSGSVDGAMSAKKIAVEGKHKGSLSCDDLKLASTSQVQADVVAKAMETESGAKVNGKVDITGRQ